MRRRYLLSGLLVFAAVAAEPERVGVGATERRITLRDALEMALRNNLDLEIERTNIASAEQFLNAARGAFDYTVRWQPSYEDRTTPTSSVLFGADGKLAESFFNQTFSVQQRFQNLGSQIQASFDSSRQDTTNPFVGLTPFTTTRLLFSYNQPLLRNRLVDRDRTEIRVRARNTEISRVDLELQTIDIVSRVEFAYWDLVAARQDVVVKLDGVEWGKEQVARTRRQIDAGTLPPVEQSGAQAELERRQDTYYASLAVVTEAENQLKTLLASSREDGIWGEILIPVDEKPVAENLESDLAVLTKQGVARRPELRHVDLRRMNNDTQKALALDQLKPQVNLIAAYANNGLGGAIPAGADNPFNAGNALLYSRINELSARQGLAPVVPPSFGGIPDSLVGGFGTSLARMFGGSYQTFQVGINLDWNPRNRTASANLEQAAIAERRLALERTRLEQAITAQIRNALQALATARQRIDAADASARAAQEKLDSEIRLFQNGESTNFLVLTRQNELSDSRRRALVARLEQNKAAARLRQAAGSTLGDYQITVK